MNSQLHVQTVLPPRKEPRHPKNGRLRGP